MSIDILNETVSFSIFPNPATNYLSVKLPVELMGSKIFMYNLAGALVLTEFALQETVTLDVSCFSKGEYILELSKDRKKGYRKILIQ